MNILICLCLALSDSVLYIVRTHHNLPINLNGFYSEVSKEQRLISSRVHVNSYTPSYFPLFFTLSPPVVFAVQREDNRERYIGGEIKKSKKGKRESYWFISEWPTCLYLPFNHNMLMALSRNVLLFPWTTEPFFFSMLALNDAIFDSY